MNKNKSNKYHYEVINAGLPGANSQMISRLFEDKIIRIKPDMIILYFAFNDHSAQLIRGCKSIFLRLHDLFYYRSLFYTLLVEKVNILFSGRADPNESITAKVACSKESIQRKVRLYQDNVSKILKLSIQNNIKVIIATQPIWVSPFYSPLCNREKEEELENIMGAKGSLSCVDYMYLMQSRLIEKLRQVGQDYNLAVIGCAAIFEKYNSVAKKALFFDACHLSPEGSNLLGKTLSEYILKNEI